MSLSSPETLPEAPGGSRTPSPTFSGTSSVDSGFDSVEQDEAAAKKKFKCNQCEYSTNAPISFTEHTNAHSGIKPNKCEHCDFSTTYKSALYKHRKTHKGINANKLTGKKKRGRSKKSDLQAAAAAAVVASGMSKAEIVSTGDNLKTGNRKRKASSDIENGKAEEKKIKTNEPSMGFDQFDADSILEALDNSFIIENIEVVTEDTDTDAAAPNITEIPPEVAPAKNPTLAPPEPWRAASSLPTHDDNYDHRVDSSVLQLRAEYESLVDENPNEPHARFVTADEVIRGEFNSEGYGSHPIEWNISLDVGDNFELASDEDDPEVVTIDGGDEIEGDEPAHVRTEDHHSEELNYNVGDEGSSHSVTNENEIGGENETRPSEEIGSGTDLSSSLPVISNDTLKNILSADLALSDLDDDDTEELTNPTDAHEQVRNINEEITHSQDNHEKVGNINQEVSHPQDAHEKVGNVNDCCDESSRSKALKVENSGLKVRVKTLETKLAEFEKAHLAIAGHCLAIAKVFQDDCSIDS